jgi:DNA repair protein RadA/Sms
MVDVVLLFSGERSSSHRMLRAEKNRYGSTDELGIFEMAETGLEAVSDPSCLYWNRDGAAVSGVAVGITLEGSRPLAAEIQSLSCPTPFPYPKRTARGIEINRIQLLLAVLERRCSIFSRSNDVYVNVAGGLSLQDPAADLSICAALASSLKDVPIAPDTCLVGEVGLAGEVRPASRTHLRIREAARLGFKNIVLSAREKLTVPDEWGIKTIKVFALSQMVERLIK